VAEPSGAMAVSTAVNKLKLVTWNGSLLWPCWSGCVGASDGGWGVSEASRGLGINSYNWEYTARLQECALFYSGCSRIHNLLLVHIISY
jgi:hypothetical protein